MTDPAVLDQRRSRFALGAELSWAQLNELDRLPLLDELRRQEPITWSGGLGAWLVSSQELLKELLTAPDRFTVEHEDNLVGQVLGDMMLARDGARHDAHRQPFAPAFHLRAVKDELTAPIQRVVAALLDDMPERHVDLRRSFATPFAMAMGAHVLGLELTERQALAETYEDFAAAMAAYDDPPAVRRGAEARDRFGTVLERELDAGHEGGVLAVAGEALSREALVSNARVVLFGAIETVENLLLNTVWALLSHPEQLAMVREEPDLLQGAIDETLRWLPPVGFVERWAAADTDLGGAQIAAGEFVIGAVVLANRDPRAYPDPHRFDITRSNSRHSLAFGRGHHHCLGVNLARIEARIAVGGLLTSRPGLTLDADRPTRPHGFAGPHLDALHVRWEPG